MDAAPIWTDVKTFPWAEFHGRVDILSGGYPCQPFSAAGKRLGAEDPRHLWPFIAAGIAAMRPGACFFENVEGHISLGLPDVLQDLAGMGYRTTWCVASASECGAPHQRKRIFILAHDLNGGCLPDWLGRGLEGIRGRQQDNASSVAQPDSQLADSLRQRGASGLSRSLAGHEGFAGIADDCGGEGCGELEHAQGARGSEQRRSIQQACGCNLGEAQADWWQAEAGAYAGSANVWPSRPGEQQFAWEPPRVVGNANELRSQGRHDAGSLQAMGISRAELAGANGKHHRGPAESSLGGNSARLTHRLDHAVLHVSTDNRTDELRLLGNGVVPATAERAFRVLVGELMEATT
jgi:DNA (cytosine-5)-methyltransferase 1